jgi:hypothetical protein
MTKDKKPIDLYPITMIQVIVLSKHQTKVGYYFNLLFSNVGGNKHKKSICRSSSGKTAKQ